MSGNNSENRCRWCLGWNVRILAAAAKARWIVENPKQVDQTWLVECNNCGLVYFTGSFSEVELARMYEGYRGDEYQNRRRRYEPWYTKRVNRAIGHSPEVLAVRKKHLEDLLIEAIELHGLISPERVLDVGGDEGQFIPEIQSISEKAVLEVSGVKPIGEVKSFTNWQEIKEYSPNLIMMCHVLEHTEQARDLIANSSEVLKTDGILYIEVPLDRPLNLPSTFARPRYKRYTRWLSAHPFLFVCADLTSLLTRRVFGRSTIGSVVKQNEHVNFFDEETLVKVIEGFGFKKIKASQYKASSGVPILDVTALGVIFKKS